MDTSIKAYFGGDTTQLQAAITQAHAMTGKFAKDSAAIFEKNFEKIERAEQSLAAFRATAQMQRAAGFNKDYVLQREILALNQQISAIEGQTVQKLELQLALDQKILQLEQSIAATAARSSGAGGIAGGVRAASSEATVATGIFGKFSAALGKAFSMGNLLKGVLAGIGIQSVTAAVDTLVDRFRKAAEAAKEIETLSGRVADANIEAARAVNTDAENLILLGNDRAKLEREIRQNAGKTDADRIKSYEDQLALVALIKKEEEIRGRIEDENARKSSERTKEMIFLSESLAAIKKKDAEDAAARQKELAEATISGFNKSASLDKQLFEQKLEGLKPEERLLALERERNELLAVQKTTVKKSADYKELQIEINNTNKRIESERLDIAKQTAAAEKEITAQKAEQRSGGSFITSKNLSLASDAELQALADKYAKASFEAEQKARSQGGFPGSQAAFQIEQGTADANRSAVERELRFRGAFRMDAAFGGEANARRNFQGDPLAFDRLYQQLVTGQTDLQKQNDRLINVLTKQGIITRDPPGATPRG